MSKWIVVENRTDIITYEKFTLLKCPNCFRHLEVEAESNHRPNFCDECGEDLRESEGENE